MRHPVDLPEGYHATARGQSCTRCVAVRRGLPPGRRVVGAIPGRRDAARGPSWSEHGPAGERYELVSRPPVSD